MLENVNEAKKIIIEKTVNDIPADIYGHEGLGRLVACSETFLGNKLEGAEWYKSKETLKSIFQYLMSLSVPPTEVWAGEDSLDLVWYPNSRVIFTKEDYIAIHLQFQNYIDSIKNFSLVINYDEMSYEYENDSEAVTQSPLAFSNENFIKHPKIKEIRFVYFVGDKDEDFLWYDDEGNVHYNNQEII